MRAPVRVSVRGVIIRDDKVLLIEYDEPDVGQVFDIPGGGQEPFESMHDAVCREMLEEACAEVEVGPLLFVLDYMPPGDKYRQGLILCFACTLKDGCEPRFPDQPDPHEVAIRWVAIDDLPTINIYPHIGARLRQILRHPDDALDRYWGVITGERS